VEKKIPVILTDDHGENAIALRAKYKIMEERKGREVDQGHRTTEILKLLLMYGADPNRRDGSGSVALHDAARKGPVQAVKMLLQFKADHNIKNDSNQTPLAVAVLMGQTESASLLRQWEALKKPHEKNEVSRKTRSEATKRKRGSRFSSFSFTNRIGHHSFSPSGSRS